MDITLKEFFLKTEEEKSPEKAIRELNKLVGKTYNHIINKNDYSSDYEFDKIINDFTDELIEVTEFILQKRTDLINKIIENPVESNDKVINFNRNNNGTNNFINQNYFAFINLYQQLALDQWMLQNSALKTRTLENECNRVIEKLKNLMLHNNVIISAIKSNDKTTAVISMDSFDKFGPADINMFTIYISDFLYAAISDYKEGIILIHQLFDNGDVKEIEYGLSFSNKKFVNIDSESLRYADGNREHIKYCELGI